MIDINLYRSRIGTFLPSSRKCGIRFKRNYGTEKEKRGFYTKQLLIRILLLLSIVIATIKVGDHNNKKSEIFEHSPIVGREKLLQWKQFITLGVEQTSNYRARCLYGNKKRGIVNIHINIR